MVSDLPQMKKREGTAIKYEIVAQGNRHHITVNWNDVGGETQSSGGRT
jgi:hypothetical protein